MRKFQVQKAIVEYEAAQRLGLAKQRPALLLDLGDAYRALHQPSALQMAMGWYRQAAQAKGLSPEQHREAERAASDLAVRLTSH